ncbi:MAG: hypothetical protein EB075_09520, partial [Bacteroidetes bacterium]|nr:hypothetical protein [Bacteroidota bacterium]
MASTCEATERYVAYFTEKDQKHFFLQMDVFEIRDRVIDFRVSTLPSRFGEKVCLRLLDSGATQLGLDKLVSEADALALIRELGSKPFGMILVTGPTGS